MAPRPCLDCGALSAKARCPDHTRAGWRKRQLMRPTTPQAGYDSEHQRRRKAFADQIEQDGGVLCWRPQCKQPILPGMAWDLGHDDDDRSIVRGPEHRSCNRATNTPGRATAPRAAQ